MDFLYFVVDYRQNNNHYSRKLYELLFRSGFKFKNYYGILVEKINYKG